MAAASAPAQQRAALGAAAAGLMPVDRILHTEVKQPEDVGPLLAKLTQPIALDYSFPGWPKVFGQAGKNQTFDELVDRQEAVLRYSRPAFVLSGALYEQSLRFDSGAVDDARGNTHINIRATQCANGLPVNAAMDANFAVLFAGVPANDKVEDGQINGGLASIVRGTNTILNVSNDEFVVGDEIVFTMPKKGEQYAFDGSRTVSLIRYTKNANERFIHFGMRKAKADGTERYHVKAQTAAKRGEPMRIYINASSWMSTIYSA